MAETRTLTRHAKRVSRPMADLSPGAREERIRKHAPPHFDADKIKRGANEAVVGFVRDFCFFSFLGKIPQADKASTE